MPGPIHVAWYLATLLPTTAFAAVALPLVLRAGEPPALAVPLVAAGTFSALAAGVMIAILVRRRRDPRSLDGDSAPVRVGDPAGRIEGSRPHGRPVVLDATDPANTETGNLLDDQLLVPVEEEAPVVARSS